MRLISDGRFDLVFSNPVLASLCILKGLKRTDSNMVFSC